MSDSFPEYFVSRPPQEESLEPVYYKVMSRDGPVFWRNNGDDTGKETSFYDVLMEEKNGFGIQRINKEHTPWDETH